jgi:restriction system protein
MKLRMHDNSLFAVLLRSPWWISMGIGAALFAAARFALPEAYKIYAFFFALPFLVIGTYTAWQQLRRPSAARVADTLAAIRAMSWEEFSAAIEDAFRREGYAVKRLNAAEADFELLKAGRVSLVGCKRWKVARTGIEPLRELHDAKGKFDAHECIYVAAGEVTDNARKYAAEQAIRLVSDAALATLLPRKNRKPRKP